MTLWKVYLNSISEGGGESSFPKRRGKEVITRSQVKEAFIKSKKTNQKVRINNWLFWASKTYQGLDAHPGFAWKWHYYAKEDSEQYQVGGWDSIAWACQTLLRLMGRNT